MQEQPTAQHTADLAHADAQAVHIAHTVVHRLTPGTVCGDTDHYTADAWYGTGATACTYSASGVTPIAALAAAMALLGAAIGTPEEREGAQVSPPERTTTATGGAL